MGQPPVWGNPRFGTTGNPMYHLPPFFVKVGMGIDGQTQKNGLNLVYGCLNNIIVLKIFLLVSTVKCSQYSYVSANLFMIIFRFLPKNHENYAHLYHLPQLLVTSQMGVSNGPAMGIDGVPK